MYALHIRTNWSAILVIHEKIAILNVKMSTILDRYHESELNHGLDCDTEKYSDFG